MTTLLVSLVSDQTIPNVQLIKEFQGEITDYLFISTEGMENKGTRKWIEDTCGIKGKVLIVKQFSFLDIKEHLNTFDFDTFDKIAVNLTGGTKVMTLVASDYFKDKGADIYYVTGEHDEYLKLFPVTKNNLRTFNEKISLSDYLHSYGFDYTPPTYSGFAFEQSKKIYNAFCSKDISPYLEAIKFLQKKRNKAIDTTDYYNVDYFLKVINYTPITPNKLSKEETKYLTGEWFEEYIGMTIKEELCLSDNELFVGTVISKHLPSQVKNMSKNLLGKDAMLSEDSFNNEMDVMFMFKNKFYSIECKSSIVALKTIEVSGEYREKEYNILGETIYKSDSLKNRFGLYPQTYIITLSDFKQYWRVDDFGQQKNKIREMEELINRANLSQIKLIDKSMLCESNSISDLIVKR